MAGDVGARSPLKAGTKLGRYSIIEPLGAGGMGVVYRALDEKLERIVALKILAPGILASDDERTRFRREALALAKLSHAHIATVFDVGEQDGVDYIVMEFVPGESLAAKLRSGALEVKDATAIMQQIAQALEEAHERGVIHRDLKPANVMITPKGHAKVLDFGLAKLLTPTESDQTMSLLETKGVAGTPLYMSPEQVYGKPLDVRTDLWSLGCIYYETVTGQTPFRGTSTLELFRAITEKEPASLNELRPEAPSQSGSIVARALEKDRDSRYQSASEVTRDTSDLLLRMSASSLLPQEPKTRLSRNFAIAVIAVLLLIIAAGGWFYHRWSQRHWAEEKAIPQINTLIEQSKSLAAFLLIRRAQSILPDDPRLKQVADANTTTVSVTSSPSGALVAIQDYNAPGNDWYALGTTPLTDIRIPKGYFRWRITKPGAGELLVAPIINDTMNFRLDAAQNAPPGMVYSPGEKGWREYIDFIGWVGPYNLPPYYIDRYEVSDRDYQKFVDSGGYAKQQYWPEKFTHDGHELSWSDAMALFRDTTGRPGPSTWVAGHYPDGQGDYPVNGVSWYEATAYAAFAGQSLPVMAQRFQAAPPDVSASSALMSNINVSGSSNDSHLAPVGKFQGLGVYGTYDMAGNVREWVVNSAAGDTDIKLILGGSWKSPAYFASEPEALSSFDRSDVNGFRCVRNLVPLPAEPIAPVKVMVRDFANFNPATDEVFRAYEAMYAYPRLPLNAKLEGIVEETSDWRKEKVSFDTGYRGERMSAYLFLPKNVKPPYQTVLFFPSARVLFIQHTSDLGLGDLTFVDYVIQSGRAVVYPIYQGMYERQVNFYLPNGAQNVELTADRYKDASRTLDYLATRPDIDSKKLAYLGVSMGSAEGVIITELMQSRLKTAVFLDGGYFLESPPPGGDQADFAPRLKIPVLMVNGRYDFTFSLERSQNPMFNMLGTPSADKQHVVLDTPHNVTEQRAQLVKAVLEWLDKYLGRV
jgi:eukaryotic-like serine/threonine-protein kinase